jgi:hypothetical protein
LVLVNGLLQLSEKDCGICSFGLTKLGFYDLIEFVLELVLSRSLVLLKSFLDFWLRSKKLFMLGLLFRASLEKWLELVFLLCLLKWLLDLIYFVKIVVLMKLEINRNYFIFPPLFFSITFGSFFIFSS